MSTDSGTGTNAGWAIHLADEMGQCDSGRDTRRRMVQTRRAAIGNLWWDADHFVRRGTRVFEG